MKQIEISDNDNQELAGKINWLMYLINQKHQRRKDKFNNSKAFHKLNLQNFIYKKNDLIAQTNKLI